MKKFVVFLKDWEQHKTLVIVLSDRQEAKFLCDVLNDKCDKAVGMDYDEIMDFGECNKLNLTKSMIRAVGHYGSCFYFEEIEYSHSIDYSIFDYDWDETKYDWCTSDYTHADDWTEVDWDDFYFDHEMGVYDGTCLKHINQHKLSKLVSGNNTYKRFDKEFAHPDVAYKYAWYDPIHDFCNNKGYRNAVNKIDRLIARHVKGGIMAEHLVDLIKGCNEWKHSNTFKSAAKHYIDTLENPFGGYGTGENWGWMLSEYVYQNGCVMNKADARKYWGYEEICDICGKDHG